MGPCSFSDFLILKSYFGRQSCSCPALLLFSSLLSVCKLHIPRPYLSTETFLQAIDDTLSLSAPIVFCVLFFVTCLFKFPFSHNLFSLSSEDPELTENRLSG